MVPYLIFNFYRIKGPLVALQRHNTVKITKLYIYRAFIFLQQKTELEKLQQNFSINFLKLYNHLVIQLYKQKTLGEANVWETQHGYVNDLKFQMVLYFLFRFQVSDLFFCPPTFHKLDQKVLRKIRGLSRALSNMGCFAKTLNSFAKIINGKIVNYF